jgi:hypothetical protein
MVFVAQPTSPRSKNIRAGKPFDKKRTHSICRSAIVVISHPTFNNIAARQLYFCS